MVRRLLGAACVIAGAAGVTACLLAASAGMRDVMRTDGGFCASGGPYVIANQCSGADERLLLVGILGGLVATAVLAGGGSLFGRTGSSGLLAWVATFGLLGWNFISLSIHPPAGQPGTGGWLISGVVFWLLAVCGLVPLLSGVFSDLRTAGRPDPVAASMQPLVRAQFRPASWGAQPGSAAEGMNAVSGPGSPAWGSAFTPVLAGAPSPVQIARDPSAAWLGLWVGLIIVGCLVGAVASTALIPALR